MITVKSIGGLGNQMFQYALYLKLKHIGKKVVFDDNVECATKDINFELGIFDISYYKPQLFDYLRYTNPYCKIFKGKKYVLYDEKLDIGYQPEIYNINNGCLRGYWQCERYFADIENEIRRSYRFKLDMSDECKKMEEKINSCKAASVHIRRGDYLLPHNAKNYEGICTEYYYKEAMNYIRERCPQTVFFFFSDDLEWVKSSLYKEGDIIVDCNRGNNSYWDMYLMSKCKNNVIANSSFSWWGAWLNDYKSKIVVAPHRWFNHLEVSDAICEDWIKI